jgi:hypothetical protein
VNNKIENTDDIPHVALHGYTRDQTGEEKLISFLNQIKVN